MKLRFLPALALLAACASTQPSAEAQQVVLKFSHFLGPTSMFQRDLIDPWARELEAKTAGRVKVEIYAADSPLGKLTEQATQVRNGTVDIALGLRGSEGDRFPGTSIIELPFLVPSSLQGSRALWALYRDGPLAREYADYKVLALSVHDPGAIHTASKRVVKPADVAGLRLRSPNDTVSGSLKQLQAVPVVLQTDAVMSAVRSRSIEGVVTNWANPYQEMNDYMKFHIDLKFYVSAFFIVMNKEKYASLPADVRAAIDALSGEVLVTRFARLWDTWAAPLQKTANGPGHTLLVPDAATMAEWYKALDPVADRYLTELAARFPEAREVYARLQKAATATR